MNLSPERLAHINPAREAVADAMMAAQAYQYDLDGQPEELMRAAKKGEARLASFQELKTSGNCNKASRIVLTHLAYKAAELFSSLVVVIGEKGKNQPFKGGSWASHSIFVAKDNNGIYFAGSPANYIEKSSRNRLAEIFSSRSIHEVMDLIKEAEGGEWPIAGYIEDVMENNSFRFPKRKNPQSDRLTALTISRELNEKGMEDRLRAMSFELYDFENGKIVILDRGKPSPMAVW